MSIKSLMGGASSAMQAHRAMMDLVGKNISNANTPNYSRQRMTLSPDTHGLFVSMDPIRSIRSSSIHRSLLGAEQGMGFQEGRTFALQIAEPGLNDLHGNGVSAAMDDFFLAVSELSGNPAGLGEREHLLAKVRSLSQSIRRAKSGIRDAQKAAEEESGFVIKQANQLLTKIATLNKQIKVTNAAGANSGEFVDIRDGLMRQLSRELDVTVLEQKDGTVSVSLTSGKNLVDGEHAAQVALESAVVGGPLEMKITRADGSVISGGLAGGRLGGLLETRDVTLKSAGDQLDQLAFGIITDTNAIHEAGFGTDGSTGTALFEPVGAVAGAADSMAISAAIDGQPEKVAAALDNTLLPGDDSNIQALLGLQDATLLPGGKSYAEGWDSVVLSVSQPLHDAKSDYDNAELRLSQLEGQRASDSGVSIQEEMIALSQAERAFEASSRVIQTANELYDTILRMV